jgi:hypothetical protein
MADGYVCFDEDPKLETFFIFGESKVLREFLQGYDKLDTKSRDRLKQDFLIVRGYDKGVVNGDEDVYDKKGDDWVDEEFPLSKESEQRGRLRLTITWETMRYKRVLEILDEHSNFVNQVARYGKCERVSPKITQHGNP